MDYQMEPALLYTGNTDWLSSEDTFLSQRENSEKERRFSLLWIPLT